MSIFDPFGLQHWLATSVTVGLGVLLPALLRWEASPRVQERARKIIAVCLFAYIGLGPAIRAGVYGLPLREHLPLHLCGISVVLGAFMLWLRSYRLYEVVYFWGIGGVLAALLTPDLQQAFPHPLFLLFFFGHGLAFTAVMFATLVMGFRPRAISLAIVLAASAAYALLIYPLNVILGSNYLYLIHKPAQPSPLDYFGPWPWYLAGLVALAVGVCGVLYLPFAIRDYVANFGDPRFRLHTARLRRRRGRGQSESDRHNNPR